MTSIARTLTKKAISGYSRFFQTGTGPSAPHQLGRIAYFIAGGIGDAIMAFPALRFLRRHLPDARLTVYVPPEKEAVISLLFRELQVVPLRTIGHYLVSRTVGTNRFDASFTNVTAVFRLRVELAAFFSGRRAFGFRYPHERPGQRLYRQSAVFSSKVHAVTQNLRLVADGVGIPFEERDSLAVYEEGGEGIRQACKNAVLHPGSEPGYENKRWPADRFYLLAQRLVGQGYAVSILLGPGETALRDTFASLLPAVTIVEPDAATLVDTIKNASLFVGNDSGPAHIAGFFNVPAVTLFGPTHPEHSRSLSPATATVYHPPPCAPCHFSRVECRDNRCMAAVTLEQVWREVVKKLSHG